MSRTFLRASTHDNSSTDETTRSAQLNIRIPYEFSSDLKGYLKVGGKYTTTDRARDRNRLSERFYYLGGAVTRDALNASSRDISVLDVNPELISILSFLNNDVVPFVNESGEEVDFQASIDPDHMRQWYEDQRELLNNDRVVVVDRYEVEESVSAFYTMAKFEFFQKITLIPGFRYEYSDNIYSSGVSSLSGRYGSDGFYETPPPPKPMVNFFLICMPKFNLLTG